jgi:hypothetical protein
MKAIFEVHPNVNELICFEDGTCFLTDAAGKCGSQDYARKTGLKSELIKREIEENEVKPKNKNK